MGLRTFGFSLGFGFDLRHGVWVGCEGVDRSRLGEGFDRLGFGLAEGYRKEMGSNNEGDDWPVSLYAFNALMF